MLFVVHPMRGSERQIAFALPGLCVGMFCGMPRSTKQLFVCFRDGLVGKALYKKCLAGWLFECISRDPTAVVHAGVVAFFGGLWVFRSLCSLDRQGTGEKGLVCASCATSGPPLGVIHLHAPLLPDDLKDVVCGVSLLVL